MTLKEQIPRQQKSGGRRQQGNHHHEEDRNAGSRQHVDH